MWGFFYKKTLLAKVINYAFIIEKPSWFIKLMAVYMPL